MRLWSLHPKYLDPKGLVALWREALLARAVLAGRTKGYVRHPQLDRFRASADPVAMIDAYLCVVWDESRRRHYSFDERKIRRVDPLPQITVTRGQLAFEWSHLERKLVKRDRQWLKHLGKRVVPEANAVFAVVDGSVEEWERGADRA